MRKHANKNRRQSKRQSQPQPQLQPQPQPQQPSQPSHGIYHKGTWYNPQVYAWKPYPDDRNLSYNQSFHDAAYPADYNQVESSNTNPYNFQPCSDRSSNPEELPQEEQQQQQMYYFQPYPYQQAEQVYQGLPVPQYQAAPQQGPELPPQQPTQPISTFQPNRHELTPFPSTRKNGSNTIEIELASSCDLYISSTPANLVINITSELGEDHYVIRKQAANVKPESKVSFAHDHDESYPVDYSNSEDSLYWAEPQGYVEQGYVENPEGQQLESNGYDPYRAPRRITNHHQQTEVGDHLVYPLPTVFSLDQNTILEKSNGNQETTDNQEYIPMESLSQADQIPKTLSNSNVPVPYTILPRRITNHHPQTEVGDHLVYPLPTVFSLDQNIILEKSNGNQETTDNQEYIPMESLSQADQIPKTLSNSNVPVPYTILPTIPRTCDHGSLENVSENAGNLTINTESAIVLPEETEDIEMANPENQILSQFNLLAKADKNEEKQDIELTSSTQPCIIKYISERAEVDDKSNMELVQCSESIRSQKSNEVHKPPAIVNESIYHEIPNILSPNIKHKDIEDKVKTENASKLEMVQSLDRAPPNCFPKPNGSHQRVIQASICSEIPNISSSKIKHKDIQDKVKAENASRRKGVQRLRRAPSNVVPKINGSHQREKQKPPKRKNTMTAAIGPKICQKKPEEICDKPQNILSSEDIVPSTTDAHKVVTISNSKRRKIKQNKKDEFMDSIPMESGPVQAFGSQQACSIKKNPNKLSKLERKALRQIKVSQKELKSKEPTKEAEISKNPEEIPQTDDDHESDGDSDDERFALSNISNAQIRRTLRRIIYKINDL